MAAAKPELKDRCIRLRIDNRMSLRDIVEETGAAQSSVSKWVRPYPLTDDEQKLRRKEKEEKYGHYGRARRVLGDPSKYFKMTAQPLSSEKKGRIAEAAVLTRFVLHDFETYGGTFGKEKMDLVVRLVGSEKLIRIQVRWAATASYGMPYVHLTKSDGRRRNVRYEKDDFDFIVAYDLHDDVAYVFSQEDTKGNMKTISVRDDVAEDWEKVKEFARKTQRSPTGVHGGIPVS